ncbi:MAG TPA: outer membrane beta-barrel protein [Candidatus Limnocylindrales bacterium]|nr:outer membrane beta-barrel protein [Candidatus Limnocylindrales bacterium]
MNRSLHLLTALALLSAAAQSFAGAYGQSGHAAGRSQPAKETSALYVETRVRIDDPARSGPYLQIGGAYGVEALDVDGYAADWQDSWGYDIRGGYRSHAMFATEVEWQHYLGFDGRPSSAAAGSGAEIEASMLSFNGKLYPMSGRVQPFLLTGVGWQNVEQRRGFEEDGLSLRFGAGVDVYVTSNVGVAVEGGYVWPVSSQLADAEEVNIIPVNASIFVRFM